MPYPSIQITSPTGGSTVPDNFSASGTAMNADGNTVTGEVRNYQGQQSPATNSVTISNNAWTGLDFSVPSGWSGGGILRVWIVSSQAYHSIGVNFTN